MSNDRLDVIPLQVYDSKEKLKSFDSGNEEINKFIHDEVYESDRQGTSTTIVTNDNNEIVGFFTLHTTTIRYSFSSDEETVPAISIAYIAVDSSYQKKGYGSRMLRYIYEKLLANYSFIGFNALILESYADCVEFYEKNNFTLINSFCYDSDFKGTKLHSMTISIIEMGRFLYGNDYTER